MRTLKSSVALGLLLVSSLALAAQPKTTLTVERIVIINNGTSSGKSITSHVFTKRFYNEADCLLARNVYRAENTLKIGPSEINADVATKAECDALDNSVVSQAAGY